MPVTDEMTDERQIVNAIGVSPVDWDTRWLTQKAAELGGRGTVLDMGTGTGFLAISLALRGITCDGADVNPAAIDCARQNASRHDVDVDFRQSNLFDNIDRRYDLIVFNPPYGNTGSVGSTRLLEIAKSLIPKEGFFARRIGYWLIRPQRLRLIRRFLSECQNYLEEDGRILLLLHESELGITSDFSTAAIEPREELRMVLLERSSTADQASHSDSRAILEPHGKQPS